MLALLSPDILILQRVLDWWRCASLVEFNSIFGVECGYHLWQSYFVGGENLFLFASLLSDDDRLVLFDYLVSFEVELNV